MAENKDIKINKSRLTKAEGGNLIPFNQMETVEKQRIAQMGGIASGEAKRKKKTIKQYMKTILEMAPTQREKEVLEQMGLINPDDPEVTKSLMLAGAIYREAIKGNMRALRMAETMQDEIEKRDISNVTDIISALKDTAPNDWEEETKEIETKNENEENKENPPEQVVEAIKGDN